MADAIARWLAAVLAALGWFFTGTLKQQAKELEREIERVEAANRAAADMRGKSFHDRVQYLGKRGRLRSVPGK